MWKCATIAGLVLCLVGVLLLFRYGMPYRIETKGRQAIILNKQDEGAKTAESVYRFLGYVGLGLVVAGTFLQIYGAYTS